MRPQSKQRGALFEDLLKVITATQLDVFDLCIEVDLVFLDPRTWSLPTDLYQPSLSKFSLNAFMGLHIVSLEEESALLAFPNYKPALLFNVAVDALTVYFDLTANLWTYKLVELTFLDVILEVVL